LIETAVVIAQVVDTSLRGKGQPYRWPQRRLLRAWSRRSVTLGRSAII